MHGWLSATPDLLFHAYLLALSHSGRHERTAVFTLLLCAGPIEGCSAVLAVRTVDTAAVALGTWFVCAQQKTNSKTKKLRGWLLRVDTASSLQEEHLPSSHV